LQAIPRGRAKRGLVIALPLSGFASSSDRYAVSGNRGSLREQKVSEATDIRNRFLIIKFSNLR